MTTILVIEDNPDNMALIEQILEDEGFETLKTDRAEDGIKQLKTSTVRVDLILMDISLPVMNGLEATGMIKQDPLLKDIPLIVLTAHAMETDKEAAFSAGCNDFLSKPIDEDKLLAAINHYLKK
ncbi:MAG: response regulator [bacterium]